MSKTEIDRIFKLIDMNNSGSMDYSEFLVAAANRNKLIDDSNLRQAF